MTYKKPLIAVVAVTAALSVMSLAHADINVVIVC